IKPLHTEVQWSDASRKVDFGSLKYVTMEALMRQAARATFFNAPSLHELPTPDGKSTFVIDVNIVDDEEIRELNNQYRGKDTSTDVLSFAQLEGESTFGAGDQILLGDIIISLPTALKQAKMEGHPLPEEMAFLTVHATLHLLGYDHGNAADKKLMWEQQNAIMARICNWPPNRKR
ncbi:MAG: rRNA maturation RNase YbeY, partial [Abditibacteriaceae bacterium]